jgi:hypothetical protein
LFLDPRKKSRSKSKISLDDIQVAECRIVTKDGGINQIQPIATVVGTNKTTTLNSPVPKIIHCCFVSADNSSDWLNLIECNNESSSFRRSGFVVAFINVLILMI